MRLPIIMLAVAVTLALALPAFAAKVSIQKYSVIPVVMDDGLSSAKSKVGDKFETHCTGANCGGFPMNTTFVGVITQVTPAGSGQPGDIAVEFIEVKLPDNTALPIKGTLHSLADDALETDPVTGNLVGKKESHDRTGRFAAAGAGIGFLITRDEPIKGAAKGALIGAAVGRIARRRTKVEDVTVPIGTEVGVMLRESVTFEYAGLGPAPIVTKAPDGTLLLQFTDGKPYVVGDALMIPTRAVMSVIGRPVSFDEKTKTVTVRAEVGTIQHVILTDQLTINGVAVGMKAPSVLRNNILYAPKEALELASGKKITWSAGSSTLALQ